MLHPVEEVHPAHRFHYIRCHQEIFIAPVRRPLVGERGGPTLQEIPYNPPAASFLLSGHSRISGAGTREPF